MTAELRFAIERSGEGVRLDLFGAWTVRTPGVETDSLKLEAAAAGARHVAVDIARVDRLDTAGAWLISRLQNKLETDGAKVEIVRARPEFESLLEEAKYRPLAVEPRFRSSPVIDFLADVGSGVAASGRDFVNVVAFLGEVIASLGRDILRPARFRWTSIVSQVENFAFQGIPIVALINFLVGCIVAQQGIFQLRVFGASAFAVDLIGILVLRELAVLLTSIMVAGRSGSAITAELGSMKMNEEIDALHTMGLRPIDVLVVPRVIALIISLPLLTFIADMSALFGGLLVAWGYGGIAPAVFMSRLQSAIGLNTFLVGLIKAPFMALMIGMIASIEGFGVGGSAELLGRQVTSSVVKAIFMVIVVDGLFAMFFATINY